MKDPIRVFLIDKRSFGKDFFIELDEVWIGSNLNIDGYKSCFYNFDDGFLWLKLIKNPFMVSYHYYSFPYDRFRYEKNINSYPNGQIYLIKENITLTLGFSETDRDKVHRSWLKSGHE